MPSVRTTPPHFASYWFHTSASLFAICNPPGIVAGVAVVAASLVACGFHLYYIVAASNSLLPHHHDDDVPIISYIIVTGLLLQPLGVRWTMMAEDA